MINVSNEDTWGKTNSSEFAISATLTVKRAQIDGDNMVLDYNVILGYINKNVYGELVFTRADASCMNLETWLNNEMDAYEISTYMSEYDKKKVNNAVDYNKEKMIAEAANCLAVKFIDALSIPTGQLSLSTRIGYGLGNALYNTPVANVIASRATNSAENSGYNTDLSEMYKQSMKQNAEKVNQAAQKLNVKTSQQKAKELSDRMKKKGIFGMFQ